MMNSTIAVLQTPTHSQAATQLAQFLQLPLHETKQASVDFYLYYDDTGLSLAAMHLPLGPLQLNFATGALATRFKTASIHKEVLARAVGLHKKKELVICDATAGVGREGCLLAALGAHVTLVERSSIIAALLQDALTRSQASWQERVTLVCQDSRSFLQSSIKQFDVIYLDPMFEEDSHKAQVKKEMQYLQALIGYTEDADSLLQAALNCKSQRVVVKRPHQARHLLDKKPQFVIEASSYRFDVYVN